MIVVTYHVEIHKHFVVRYFAPTCGFPNVGNGFVVGSSFSLILFNLLDIHFCSRLDFLPSFLLSFLQPVEHTVL